MIESAFLAVVPMVSLCIMVYSSIATKAMSDKQALDWSFLITVETFRNDIETFRVDETTD